MQKILLTLVVKNSKHGNESESIKQELLKLLPPGSTFVAMNKYHKFRNSYMLDFAILCPSRIRTERKILKMLEVSNLIARPWLVYFDTDNPEFIFNKTTNTVFARKKFDSILWGHIQIS